MAMMLTLSQSRPADNFPQVAQRPKRGCFFVPDREGFLLFEQVFWLCLNRQ